MTATHAATNRDAVYRDSSRTVEDRVADLLGRMTLEEKAGLMFHTMTLFDPSMWRFSGLPSAAEMVTGKLMNHFNLIGGGSGGEIAEWNNTVQRAAAETRLGIPVTISTDPRHGVSDNMAASMSAGAFSAWPDPIGLAATNDPELVQEFGDIARQEYVAAGIRVALHPMADLATEPRWARISGTFGEDAELSATMTGAYIRGFQGEQLGPQSVFCMTKHFPGGGPQKDGEDAHFEYGREQVYPGDNFDYHLIPFEAAFEAGTAQIMPYYGMPVGLPLEEVGFGFNHDVITTLLREKYRFDGVVCTDWGLLSDIDTAAFTMKARAWGVEHLSREDRALKALLAGVDQFGGESCPEVVVELAHGGRISESRIDVSVRRLLRDKFRSGLFDHPFVDPEVAEETVGHEHFRRAGEIAQRKSIVLLRDAGAAGRRMLPLGGSARVYVENVDPAALSGYAELAPDLSGADVAILRLKAPYEQRDGSFLERFFHAGDLRFPEEELRRIRSILETVPTIVDIYLDRPAVIPEIASESVALLGSFGASDAALLDVIFGKFEPTGKLPFELPSSMEAVRAQRSDVPFDSHDPLFPFGHGLRY